MYGTTVSFLNAPLIGDATDGEGGGAGGGNANKSLGVRAGGGNAKSKSLGVGAGDGYKGRGYARVGTVAGAGLAPSALLTFSWREPSAPGRNTDGIAQVLSDALMRDATPLE